MDRGGELGHITKLVPNHTHVLRVELQCESLSGTRILTLLFIIFIKENTQNILQDRVPSRWHLGSN